MDEEQKKANWEITIRKPNKNFEAFLNKLYELYPYAEKSRDASSPFYSAETPDHCWLTQGEEVYLLQDKDRLETKLRLRRRVVTCTCGSSNSIDERIEITGLPNKDYWKRSKVLLQSGEYLDRDTNKKKTFQRYSKDIYRKIPELKEVWRRLQFEETDDWLKKQFGVETRQ